MAFFCCYGGWEFGDMDFPDWLKQIMIFHLGMGTYHSEQIWSSVNKENEQMVLTSITQ